MRRFIPSSLRSLLIAAGLAASLAAPAGAVERVAVRAYDHGTFGRLAFEWPAPIEVESAPGPDELTLRFARPFDGDLGVATARLHPYLRAAVRGATAAEVVLRLEPGTNHKLLTIGDRVVAVDFLRGEPAAPPVPVRTGLHDDYVRIDFDLPFPARYDVERSGERVTIRFDRPARIDVAPIARDLGPLVAVAEAESGAEASRVILGLAPGAGLQHFALPGNRVVIDVLEPSDATAAGPGEREVEPPAAVASPSAPEPRAATAAPEAAEAEVARGEAGGAASPPALSAPPAPIPPLTLAVGSGAADGGAALRFDWSLPVAAAVFVRAGHLWAVFPAEPANAGAVPPAFDAALGEILGPGEVVAAEGGLALRFPLRRRVEPHVTRRGSVWHVALRDEAPPPRPLEPRRLDEPPRLFFPGAGTVVRLTDPEVGDRLHALPLLEGNRGQPETRRLVELELLATAQGIVWRPLADGLRSHSVEGGVELGTPEGLRLTILPAERRTDRADADAARRTTAEAETGDAQRSAAADVGAAEPTGPGPPLGLAAVPFDPGDSALAHQRTLVERVLSVPPGQRDEARLDLARFLLSRALAGETLAVLGTVGAAADESAAAPTVLARDGLAGAAQLLMGRLPEAEARLMAEALDDDPEVALWRAVLAAAKSDWPRAARELERSERTLANYPPPLRARLGVTAALITLEAGRPEAAYAVLSGLKGLGLSSHDEARLRFTEGLVLARDGALTAAEQTWRELATTAPPETRHKAHYALTALLLEAGQIGPDEALGRLEAARPFWRGHPWEVTMLDGLARVHAQRRDHHRALATWKEAIGRRPQPGEAQAIAEAMSALYLAALTAGGESAPSALEALALYRDYPELTPSGAVGDRLARRLAERLAAMDLIEDAAALLERQVRHRLKGTAKAEAGAYLAELWLRKPVPEAALEALRLSATAAELPTELQRRRRLVEARALVAAGRSEDALAALDGDRSRDAQLLRAAIHFDRREWPRVIEVAAGLLPQRIDAGATLGREERELVVRLALARAQMDDWAGLRELRARFGKAMAGSPDRAAFAMATGGDPGAGDARAVLAGSAEQIEAVRALLAGGIGR